MACYDKSLISPRPVASVVVAAICAFGLFGPVSGCQNGGLGGMESKLAMEMLSPAIKDAANAYLNNLSALVSAAQGVQGYEDAFKLAQKAEPMLKQISSAYQTLSGLSPEDRKNLIAAFGPKIDSTNSSFADLTGKVKNTSWGQVVSPVLDQVKLFK